MVLAAEHMERENTPVGHTILQSKGSSKGLPPMKKSVFGETMSGISSGKLQNKLMQHKKLHQSKEQKAKKVISAEELEIKTYLTSRGLSVGSDSSVSSTEIDFSKGDYIS